MRKSKFPHQIFHRTALSLAIATVSVSTYAQTENDTEELIVTGIRGSLERSLDIKREASGVVDAISSEDIGKFPDTNLAESLQRITGVSIDRSGGEGQYITVRGFGPEFNTVLINGRQIASENLNRAFSFDTLASEMVKSIEVKKTSSAAVQSGGVGATVDIITARPFDFDGIKTSGSIKTVYDENSEESTPQLSGLMSYSNGTFGVLGAISYQERETRLNQAQIDGWLENVDIPTAELNDGAGLAEGLTLFSPRNYDHKVTFEERKRTNANLIFQFAPSDELTLTGDLLYSDFDIETDATSYGHWFTASNIEDASTDEHGTVVDLYQEVGLATDMHAKKFDRLTETTAVGFNADWQASEKLNLKFDAHFSQAKREPNNGRGNQLSLIGYANRAQFIVDGNILPYVTNFAEANPDIYSGQQELDETAYLDPTELGYETPDGVQDHLSKENSRAHVMLRRGWAVEDDVQQFKFDGTWEEGDSGLQRARFGMMYTMQEKSLDRWDNETGVHCTYCGYPDMPEIPESTQYIFDAGSDFLGDVSGSGRMPTQWLAHDGEAHFAWLESYYASNNSDTISFDAIKRNNSFTVNEDTLAAYLELDFEGELAGGLLSATTGVRIESTDTEVDGITEPVTGLEILDETEMLAQYGEAESITVSKGYDAILPSMSARWDITDTVVGRLAASKSITRPTLESMSPVTVITTTRQGGNLTSTTGNPELEPFVSDNFDLSVEWYYGDADYLSVGYFKKDVANFIVNTQSERRFIIEDGSELIDPSTGEVAVFSETAPINGEVASVDGLEFALQHAFGDTGFGVIANFTIVNSDAELDPSDVDETFALTGLSDSRNLVGYYEQGPFQIRLAYNWRDEFVQSLTQVQGDGPTIVEDYTQWDMSASLDILQDVTIFFEGINLTEEFVHKRGRYNNHLLLVEDSGRRFMFGVRASF